MDTVLMDDAERTQLVRAEQLTPKQSRFFWLWTLAEVCWQTIEKPGFRQNVSERKFRITEFVMKDGGQVSLHVREQRTFEIPLFALCNDAEEIEAFTNELLEIAGKTAS